MLHCLQRSLLLGLVLAAIGTGARSESLEQVAGRYTIEPASSIAFTVPQIGGGGISGRFADFSGSFRLDASNIARSRVDFTLRPESVVTGQSRVDNFLRSDAVFDAVAYPVITFRSYKVTQDGGDGAIVEGTLNARGIAHPETFRVKLTRHHGRRVELHVDGKVLRSRYGMDVGTPIYSNVVAFDMTVRGARN